MRTSVRYQSGRRCEASFSVVRCERETGVHTVPICAGVPCADTQSGCRADRSKYVPSYARIGPVEGSAGSKDSHCWIPSRRLASCRPPSGVRCQWNLGDPGDGGRRTVKMDQDHGSSRVVIGVYNDCCASRRRQKDAPPRAGTSRGENLQLQVAKADDGYGMTHSEMEKNCDGVLRWAQPPPWSARVADGSRQISDGWGPSGQRLSPLSLGCGRARLRPEDTEADPDLFRAQIRGIRRRRRGGTDLQAPAGRLREQQHYTLNGSLGPPPLRGSDPGSQWRRHVASPSLFLIDQRRLGPLRLPFDVRTTRTRGGCGRAWAWPTHRPHQNRGVALSNARLLEGRGCKVQTTDGLVSLGRTPSGQAGTS
ncbi:hypothetical protein C8Q79DRAFT_318083 [Trametes meyenii]|nr:hypothetical protein C8Q79DRAFT_318083 [Trametes meyenii]